MVAQVSPNKRLTGIVLAVGLLLLVFTIANQFLDDWNWSGFDFVVAAGLLLGTGLLCELVMRQVRELKLRVVLCVVIVAALIIIWAELAVGIFGTPFAGN